MRRQAVLFLLCAVLGSCKNAGVSTAAGAATMTTLAIGTAAYERSQGGCIAICTNGTVCNGRTGLCEVLPCRGRCGGDEHCEVTFSESKCMPGAGGVTAQASGGKTQGPAIVPVSPPNTTSAAPTIVPTAEQQPPKGN